MSVSWDTVLVWAAVAAAVLYLARGWFRRGKTAGGGCGSCPAAAPPHRASPALVQIEPRPPSNGAGA